MGGLNDRGRVSAYVDKSVGRSSKRNTHSGSSNDAFKKIKSLFPLQQEKLDTLETEDELDMIKKACDGNNNKIIISGNQSECESKIGIGPPKYSDDE